MLSKTTYDFRSLSPSWISEIVRSFRGYANEIITSLLRRVIYHSTPALSRGLTVLFSELFINNRCAIGGLAHINGRIYSYLRFIRRRQF